jgi:DnaJ-class molecular chaperone
MTRAEPIWVAPGDPRLGGGTVPRCGRCGGRGRVKLVRDVWAICPCRQRLCPACEGLGVRLDPHRADRWLSECRACDGHGFLVRITVEEV